MDGAVHNDEPYGFKRTQKENAIENSIGERVIECNRGYGPLGLQIM